MTVTALLISHDGARWLPAVLDGIDAQTSPPDRVLVVDTGSTDDSVALLTERLGADAVTRIPAESSFPAAVRAGLELVADPEGWVWLLHDDSAPAPDALELLLRAAADNPGTEIVGPKLREWPSLRRLLEVGITISGTGRRETGLERGEYDQGQHDQTREVLAVNTAGMLLRRRVHDELGGFDEQLPLFGNDLDFGWRAARAGKTTLVVPDAVVFHVEAAHRGVRRTPVTGRYRRQERRAALFTLLVNCSLVALPFLAVRLLLGSLLRALGLLLVRAPQEAVDELTGLLLVYARPDRLVRGRLWRRRTATVPARDVRHLLAPPWLPYRHGLDLVTDIGSAVVMQAGEVSARRGGRADAELAETGPVPAEAQNLPADSGWFARLVTSPVAAVFTVLVVFALVAARGVLGSGFLSGGALLPAPDTALDWWSTYLATWHRIGVGSAADAAPYLVPLAVLGTVLLGKAWLVVDLLFLLAVPIAAFGGYRFLLRATGARYPALWGAVGYGLVVVLSGAVNQGRLGTVAAALLLPWVARSALALAPNRSSDRRWRAAWRTALWLAVLTAFVPLAWPLAVILAVVLGVIGLVRDRARWLRASTWAPVLVTVATVPVLLLPWAVSTLGEGRLALWLAEAGRAAPDLLDGLTGWDAVFGRAADVGAAPGWLSAGLVLAALGALLRRDTRGPVQLCWVVLVLGLAAVAVLSRVEVQLPTWSQEHALWLGFPLLLVQAAAITAAAFAANGVSLMISTSAFGWRQPVALVVVVLAIASPLAGLGWWVATGVTGPLDRTPATTVPTYMTDAAERDPNHGVLVVRGERRSGLEYVVLRDDGLRLGDESVVPSPAAQQPMTDVVTRLASFAQPEDVAALARHGIAFVYAPAPVDVALSSNLDSVSGLTSASAIRPGARAWQLEATPTDAALADPADSARGWLLLGQLLAVVVVGVLAGPTRRSGR